uniref:ATP synthase F0 subunit 8 n=1 Tax=Tonicina zschaui TaxID=2719129 RepID=A0A6H1PFZ4_9MOLL|nr:ATP synthase F0 subunit 8 [Tonicina zschaui]
MPQLAPMNWFFLMFFFWFMVFLLVVIFWWMKDKIYYIHFYSGEKMISCVWAW